MPDRHPNQGRYLRLRYLPVNELANTVLVLKLEFDRLPEDAPPAPVKDGSQATMHQ